MIDIRLTPEEHALMVAALSSLPIAQLIIKVQQAQPDVPEPPEDGEGSD